MTLAELEQRKAKMLAEIAKLEGYIEFNFFMLEKTEYQILQAKAGHNEMAAIFDNCHCALCLEPAGSKVQRKTSNA